MKRNEESIVGSVVQDDLASTNVSKEGINIDISSEVIKRRCYLETDMDKLDSSLNNVLQHQTQPNEKPIIEVPDVRSPSIEITRTPVLVC